jgi:hypothetical protein
MSQRAGALHALSRYWIDERPLCAAERTAWFRFRKSAWRQKPPKVISAFSPPSSQLRT